MRYANDVNNNVPAKGESQSPIELFSSTITKLPIRQFHHFGCPVFALDSNLQANKRIRSKWKQRTRLGINLGFSPQHLKSIHLVLSLQSGCVYPQFHCTFDNSFETLKEYNPPEPLWQHKAHFIMKINTKSLDESQGALADANHPSGNDTEADQMMHPATMDVDTSAPPEFEPPIQHQAEGGEAEIQAENNEASQVHEGVELRRSNRAR